MGLLFCGFFYQFCVLGLCAEQCLVCPLELKDSRLDVWLTAQKEKQKEIGNPRVEQHGMCGIQHSPLHRLVSVNDLIGGNVSTNAYVPQIW